MWPMNEYDCSSHATSQADYESQSICFFFFFCCYPITADVNVDAKFVLSLFLFLYLFFFFFLYLLAFFLLQNVNMDSLTRCNYILCKAFDYCYYTQQ